MSPVRVQRQRTKGWRTPPCTCGRGDPHPAIYVGRGSRWGNPYKAGTTQIRLPGAENPNIDWEIEGRLGKPNGENVPFYHADGTTTRHTVRPATAQEVTTLHAEMIGGHTGPHTRGQLTWADQTRAIREQLAGHDLMCWCPLDQPCHADTLIHLANQETKP